MTQRKSGYKEILEDENGRQTDVFIHGDLLLPGAFPDWFDPVKKLYSIKYFPYRPRDILQCSFPKSGNHWLTNILTLLLSNKPIEEVSTVNVNLIDLSRPTERLNTKQSPRIITSHLKFQYLPEDHFKKRGKVILLVRNPKDVAVSFYHHGQKDPNLNICLSWESYLKYFCEGKLPFGSYFDYLNNWQEVLKHRKDLNVHIVYYEDLKQKSLHECQRLQKYLGVYNTDERLQQIISKCSFSSLKSDVDSGKVKTLMRDRNKQPYLYRKGEIGDWKNHFTVDQNQKFDKIIKKKLKDSIFQFKYTSVMLNSHL